MNSLTIKPLMEQAADYVGKTSFVLTFASAFLTKLQVAEINGVLTLVASGITVVYLCFRTLNEIKRFRKGKNPEE